MRASVLGTLIFVAGALTGCARSEEHAAAGAQKVDCKEVATEFGRFAAVAESLCKAHRSAEESAAQRCVSDCIDRCAGAAAH